MILAIDQGTTGTTCLVVDERLQAVGRGYVRSRSSFPSPGWVEHDPEEIWASVLDTAEAALADAGIARRELTRRRDHEPARDDGRLGAAQRTPRAPRDRLAGPAHGCSLRRAARRPRPRANGARLRPLLLGHEARVDPRANRLPQQELAFGTIDSWLAWKLTGGTAHVTDVTNASRTMLLDVETGEWADELLELFSVDRVVLPGGRPLGRRRRRRRRCSGDLPLAAMAGDQQAALFGQGCFAPGEVKATYGTGTFVLANIGDVAGPPPDGLLKTVAAVAPGAQRQFAAEGAVLVGGAALQWLRDGLGVIDDRRRERSSSPARSTRRTASTSFPP